MSILTELVKEGELAIAKSYDSIGALERASVLAEAGLISVARELTEKARSILVCWLKRSTLRLPL